jgi:hypothetical protein
MKRKIARFNCILNRQNNYFVQSEMYSQFIEVIEINLR